MRKRRSNVDTVLLAARHYPAVYVLAGTPERLEAVGIGGVRMIDEFTTIIPTSKDNEEKYRIKLARLSVMGFITDLTVDEIIGVTVFKFRYVAGKFLLAIRILSE